ncbi:MAG: ATP-dependent zinc metalloprotease FtsH [Dehalococcoidia bacterium]
MGNNCLLSLSLILLAVIMTMPAGCGGGEDSIDITLSQAIELSDSGNIENVHIDTGNGTMEITAAVPEQPLEVTNTKGEKVKVSDGDKLQANIDDLNVADLQQLGFVLPSKYSTNEVRKESSPLGSIFFYLLPILIFGLLIYFWVRASRGAQGQAMNIGKSKARKFSSDIPGVSFDNVAGIEAAKEDLQEVVTFLKSRKRFQKIGATIPKGVMLVGPPGTGKTMLARAVAGEAGVSFFSISGSEFVEMFVGVGASRVRDLFQQAKQTTPCIIFIDEIDAVARARAAGAPFSHEEREQTLNQILSEMDGFAPNTGVIVLAATNRVDILDPALLRPGRFDRRVMLELPHSDARRAILEVHAREKRLDPEVDLEDVARQTHGFSGADLANLINEAAILAVRHEKEAIRMEELSEAIDRVIAGPEKKNVQINPKERETIAYHETGHALAAHILPNVDPVRKLSIVARGAMGGYTRLLQEDRYTVTESQINDTLATLLAGNAAEKMVFDVVSSGPQNDLKQATQLARKMVMDFGMSSLGVRTFTQDGQGMALGQTRDYSEATAERIDEEVSAIIDTAYNRAWQVIEQNRARLSHVADKVLEKESLQGEELEAAFEEPIDERESTAGDKEPA